MRLARIQMVLSLAVATPVTVEMEPLVPTLTNVTQVIPPTIVTQMRHVPIPMVPSHAVATLAIMETGPRMDPGAPILTNVM
jgi:hypothetical protein